MNAFEKAMKAIEKLMARGGRQVKPRATKSTKRAATKRPEVRPGKRVVGAGRRGSASGVPEEKQPGATHARVTERERWATDLPARREPFTPPRGEPDVAELRETFAPPPSPPRAGVVDVDGLNVNFSGLTPIEGGGYRHRAGVILADGELLDDWDEDEHAVAAALPIANDTVLHHHQHQPENA